MHANYLIILWYWQSLCLAEHGIYRGVEINCDRHAFKSDLPILLQKNSQYRIFFSGLPKHFGPECCWIQHRGQSCPDNRPVGEIISIFENNVDMFDIAFWEQFLKRYHSELNRFLLSISKVTSQLPMQVKQWTGRVRTSYDLATGTSSQLFDSTPSSDMKFISINWGPSFIEVAWELSMQNHRWEWQSPWEVSGSLWYRYLR